MTTADFELLLHAGANHELFEQSLYQGRFSLGHQVRVRFGPKRDVLICGQEGKTFSSVGVLRDAEKVDGGFAFRRYEEFKKPVVLWDTDGARPVWDHKGGFGGSYQKIPPSVFEAIMKEARACLDPKKDAKRFAEKAVQRFRDDWGGLVRLAYQQPSHPELDDELQALAGRNAEVSTEGGGKGARHRYYDVLGTSAFPDSAVTWPFRCAIEYDRQTQPNNSSRLKTSLLKTAAHVLSGVYDAAVHVYIFHDEHKYMAEDYGLDASTTFEIEDNYTRTFLTTLEQHGVFLAAYFPNRKPKKQR